MNFLSKYKVGPLPVINGVITPISRVITLFITCRGPPWGIPLKLSESISFVFFCQLNKQTRYRKTNLDPKGWIHGIHGFPKVHEKDITPLKVWFFTEKTFKKLIGFSWISLYLFKLQVGAMWCDVTFVRQTIRCQQYDFISWYFQVEHWNMSRYTPWN